jgi:hypothetical protein
MKDERDALLVVVKLYPNDHTFSLSSLQPVRLSLYKSTSLRLGLRACLSLNALQFYFFTILLLYSSTSLQFYCSTVLLLYNYIAIQFYCCTVLLLCISILLQHHYSTVLPYLLLHYLIPLLPYEFTAI